MTQLPRLAAGRPASRARLGGRHVNWPEGGHRGGLGSVESGVGRAGGAGIFFSLPCVGKLSSLLVA